MFEVIAYWKGKRTVRYLRKRLYNGVAMEIHDAMRKRGFTLIDVRLMP